MLLLAASAFDGGVLCNFCKHSESEAAPVLAEVEVCSVAVFVDVFDEVRAAGAGVEAAAVFPEVVEVFHAVAVSGDVHVLAAGEDEADCGLAARVRCVVSAVHG